MIKREGKIALSATEIVDEKGGIPRGKPTVKLGNVFKEAVDLTELCLALVVHAPILIRNAEGKQKGLVSDKDALRLSFKRLEKREPTPCRLGKTRPKLTLSAKGLASLCRAKQCGVAKRGQKIDLPVSCKKRRQSRQKLGRRERKLANAPRRIGLLKIENSAAAMKRQARRDLSRKLGIL